MLYRINAGWRDLMDNKSDPRTADWPLMSSPFPTIAICMTYVYIVKVSTSILPLDIIKYFLWLLTVNNNEINQNNKKHKQGRHEHVLKVFIKQFARNKPDSLLL